MSKGRETVGNTEEWRRETAGRLAGERFASPWIECRSDCPSPDYDPTDDGLDLTADFCSVTETDAWSDMSEGGRSP